MMVTVMMMLQHKDNARAAAGDNGCVGDDNVDSHAGLFLDPGFLRGDESFFNRLLKQPRRGKALVALSRLE